MTGTITVRRFAAADMLAILVQGGQAEVRGISDRTRLAQMALAASQSFTACDAATGEVLLCGGAIENHAGYASLWAVLSERAGPHMTALTRRVQHFASLLPYERIDAWVRTDFEPACRWMGLLGFTLEAGPLPGVWQDGGAALIYRKGS